MEIFLKKNFQFNKNEYEFFLIILENETLNIMEKINKIQNKTLNKI